MDNKRHDGGSTVNMGSVVPVARERGLLSIVDKANTGKLAPGKANKDLRQVTGAQ